jgi:hypothetical protein
VRAVNELEECPVSTGWILILGGLTTSTLISPLRAQEERGGEFAVLFQGGAYAALRDVRLDYRFPVGLSAGLGFEVRLGGGLGLRAEGSYARTMEVDRLTYGVDLKIVTRREHRVRPYRFGVGFEVAPRTGSTRFFMESLGLWYSFREFGVNQVDLVLRVGVALRIRGA